MHKWEYLEVRVFGPEWADSRGNCGRLEKMVLRQGCAPHWKSIAPLLNQLGAEGWELTGFADDASPNAYAAFFKRPSLEGQG